MTLSEMKDAYQAKTSELQRLADKGNDVTSTEYERAKSLHAEAKDLQAKIAKSEEGQARFAKLANVGRIVDGVPVGDTGYSGRKGMGGFGLKDSDLQELHRAAMTGTYARKTTPMDTTDSPMSTVPQYTYPVLPILRDKARISDLIPSDFTSAPSVFYFRATAGATAAAPVAEGGNKPESNPAYESVPLPVTKIAHYTSANDEVIADFGSFMDVISTELVAGLIDAENDQLLNGNGTPPECQGILTQDDIQTRDIGDDTILDALIKAVTDLRTGDSYTEPDAVVINPVDYQTIRLAKDDVFRYLLGNPLSSEPTALGNAKFVITNRIAEGTALVANFGESTKLWVREAPRIDVNPMGGAAEFIANQTLIRCEERLAAVAVTRPKGIVMVNLVPAS